MGDFLWGGDAIPTGGGFTWEASANRGHVDGIAGFGLGEKGGTFEPLEEGFSGGPGEGFSEERFFGTGGLADGDDAGDYGATGDGRAVHFRAEGAAFEVCNMFLESDLSFAHTPPRIVPTGRG